MFNFPEDEDGEIKDDIEFGGRPPLPATDEDVMPPPPVPAEASSEKKTEEEPASTINDSLVEFILNRDEAEAASAQKEEVVDAPPIVRKTVQLLESKMAIEGTPLLKSASSYDKLPDGDKWSVGVSDVINFENLPDSVGKYEKMKVLIKKVQKVVKEINSE